MSEILNYLRHFLLIFLFLNNLIPIALNNVTPANIPAKLSSPVFTLAVVSPLFTVCKFAIAFVRTSFALSTSTCVAFGLLNTALASFKAFVNPSNVALV